MGWRFPWVSSLGSNFKYDFGAAFTDEQRRNGAEYNFRHIHEIPAKQAPGMSAFARADGIVLPHLLHLRPGGRAADGPPTANLDLAPLGRNETGYWRRRHDEYEEA